MMKQVIAYKNRVASIIAGFDALARTPGRARDVRL
jgi:hypothetical protein